MTDLLSVEALGRADEAPRVDALDGIRAISVYMVIAAHLGQLAVFSFPGESQLGMLGVELFFG